MKTYTDQEMQARVEALRGVNTMEQWMSMQPKYVNRYDPALRTASQPVNPGTRQSTANGRLMTARYDGKCARCGGGILAGDTIWYDGKANHTDSQTCAARRNWEQHPHNPANRPDTNPSRYDSPEQAIEREAERRNSAHLDGLDRMPSGAEMAEDARDRFLESMQTPASEPAAFVMPDGTYTVEHADGSYRTLRVRTPKHGNLAGKQIIAYLAASDNDSDNSYVGFAFVTASGKVAMWKRYAGNAELAADASVLCDPDTAATAGERWALQSGACWRCGKTLTVPASIHRGLGPDCAKKGLA